MAEGTRQAHMSDAIPMLKEETVHLRIEEEENIELREEWNLAIIHPETKLEEEQGNCWVDRDELKWRFPDLEGKVF
ncbi:Hypothetical predicted protein [Olea europaea subsp. europaea]|uniref:Uncharacterized protein n=1 Tax=Olea europaea subsp. europaea TaxID=158383 RepID=A0A8S0VNZ1_OLEEU|nr:Hypothetical predicted protein [Olea europaea subsp. europaea]